MAGVLFNVLSYFYFEGSFMMKLAKVNHLFAIAIVSMGCFFSACGGAHFDRGLVYQD